MLRAWQVQEAKNRFSELLERAVHDGPQTVTKRGEPVVVVVDVGTWRRVAGPAPRLLGAAVSGAGAQAAERSRAADALTLAPLSEDALARFAEFVAALYVDDPGPAPMSLDRALRQARRLLGDRPPAWAFLLRDADGESIGYCILAPFFSNEFGGEMLYLDELYVVPERRGRGVGSAALAAVRNWAEQRGFVRLALEVNRGNPEARRLYERAGFAVEERDTMALQLKAIPEE